ncbi:MAG: PAS domain S-box protein, partial [Gammaproteobacteria bacterium]|nr:PAS domain S-box protein [Gammaproteobacteria bacterium]
PMVIDEVLQSLRVGQGMYTLRLSDLGEASRLTFYGADADVQGVPGGPRQRIDLAVFGRAWEAELGARPAFMASLDQTDPRRTAWVVAGIGALLSVLVYLLAHTAMRARIARFEKQDRDAREFGRVLAAQQEMAQLNAKLERVVDERTQRLDTALRDLNAILDAVPSMIGYWDNRLINRVANEAFADWFGVEPSKVPGMHFRDLLGEALFATSLPYVEGALRGEKQTFERTMPRVGGRGVRHALVHYLPDWSGHEVRGFYVLVHDVTELVEGRQQLAAVQRDNAALLGTLEKHALVAVADRHGVITEVNDNFCRVSGFRSHELVGANHRLIHAGVHGDKLWAQIRQTLASGQSWQGEVCHCASDGRLYWVDCVVASFVGASGEIEKYVSISTDITARKQAEDALVHERYVLNALLESLPDPIYFKDEQHRYMRVNPGLVRWLGALDASEVIGSTDADFYDEDHARKTAEIEQAIMASGEPVLNLEEKEIWPDRPPTWNLTTKMVLRDPEGRVIGTFGISRDISARKRMEDEVRLTNERFSLAADSVGLGVWEFDVLAGMLVWDERMYTLYGRRREGAVEPYAMWTSSLHPEDRPAVERSMQEAIDGTCSFDTEFRIVRPDGEVRHVKAAARIVRNIQGQAIRMTGVNIDVTDRARAELDLRQTMALLHAVLDAATQVSIIAVKPDGVISVFNAGAERLLGYRRDEVVDRSISLAFHDRDELAERAAALSAESGTPVHPATVLVHPSVLDQPQEWTYLRKDGASFPVSLSVTAMKDADGEHFGYLGIAHDISSRKQYEQSLRDATREAEQANRAKSQFLANMSHEIRTPMNAVIGLSYLLERTALDVEQSSLLAKIKLASKSLLGIINDVLDLSKVEAAEMRIERAPFSLQLLLSEVSSLMTFNAESKGIEFTVLSDVDIPPTLEGDPVRIQQVLTNLLTNAIKFTERGSVRLSVQVKRRAADSIGLRFEAKDTGIGMDEETLARVFTPFVQADSSTTRRFGGTGLGLSIVKQLVALMGGEVGVSSEPGKGSLFWVELDLPVSGAQARPTDGRLPGTAPDPVADEG